MTHPRIGMIVCRRKNNQGAQKARLGIPDNRGLYSAVKKSRSFSSVRSGHSEVSQWPQP